MEYTSQKAQFGSYHNGINLSLSLSNDSDVVAITADGKILGTLPNVVASVMKNGLLESTYTSGIEVAPPVAPNEEWTWSSSTDYTWDASTHTLTINNIPSGFSQGNFIFSKGDLSATFGLRTVQSNVDYDLVIDKTLINNTSSGGPILIKVRKTKEDGTVEEILSSSEVEVLYTIGTGDSQEATSTVSGWSIQYLQYNSETPNTYAPIKIELKSADGSFLWDWETIEFVQNGITPQDFNVTASAYAFVKGEDGKYESDITLTAHATNVGEDSAIKWYIEGTSTSNGGEKTYTEIGSGKTHTATAPGTYKAQLGNDWYDFVTLSEVTDGASGADAVVITTINSSMTFNKKETTTTETCEVVAWEGATELNNISISTKTGESLPNSNSKIDENEITITNPGATGSQTFSVVVTLTDESKVWKDITVNWTVVEDGAPGESVYAIVEPNTLRKGKIPQNISVEIYKKIGDGAPTVQSDTFYYTYQIDGGQISGYIGTSGNISLQNINGSLNSAEKIQFAFYSDVNGVKKLIDKATLEILADGASISGVTEYFRISDKATGVSRPDSDPTEGAPPNPIGNTWYATALAPTDSYPYLWSYEKITKDDGTSIYTEAVAIGRYGRNGSNTYSLSLDNDYDSVVYTNGGECVSGFPIKVEARKYYGSSNQSYGTVFLKYSTDNETFSELVSSVQYNKDNSNSFFSFNQMDDTRGAILEIKRLPSGFQEMIFAFEWHSSNNSSSSTYDKNTFKLKKVTALADYDLVFPQTVYNTTDTLSKVSFTVLKKSVNGTTTLTAAPVDDTTGLENEVVAYYKKINNSTTTYKKIENWSDVSKNDLQTSSVVLTSADGADVTAQEYSAFSTAPSIIWDEETIEFVSNGNNGDSLQIKYTATESVPQYPAPTGASYSWGTAFPTTITGKRKVWMVQKLSNSTTWSSPVQVSSLDGAAGKDGSDIEFEYYISQNEADFDDGIEVDPSGKNYYDKTADSGKTWTDSPSGITETNKYEYMIVRTKPSGTNTSFSNWSVPVIWSKWGDKGQDGDGVEYIYYLSNSSTAPDTPEKTDGKWKTDGVEWKDNPQGVEEDNQYEYVSKITVTTDTNGNKKEEAGTPALWAKYANDAQAIRIVSDKHQFRFDQNDIPYDDQVATLTLQGSNIDTSKAGWLIDNEIIGTGSTIQVTPEVFDFELELPNIATTKRLRFFYYHNGQAFSGDTVGNVYYTRNGSWIKQFLVDSESFVGAAYYDDNYYIIGYKGSLYKYKYSNSSSVPTSVSNKPNGNFEAIVSNGSFIAIFGYIDNNPYYWYLKQDGTWDDINVGASDKFVAAEVINGNIYALTQKGKIYKIYSNNGTSKHELITQVGSGTNWRCFYNTNDGYLVGNDSGAVYKIGSNSGEITITGKTINRIRAIKYFNGYYYIAGYFTDGLSVRNGKIYRSKDLGDWEEVNIEDSRAVWWLTIIRDRVLYCSGESGLLKKVSGEDFPFDSTSITATVDGLTDITSIIKANDVPSNYVLSLSNDSATVAAKKDGTVDEDALKFATETTATLYYGDAEETNVVYKWEVVNGALISTTGKEIYFTEMYAADAATATVKAYLVINGTEQTTAVATKVFTVTKSKQGENAISYKLLATPNRIQSGTDTAITFSVLKHDGSNTATIEQANFGTNKIKIKEVSSSGETEITTFTNYKIDATTTYKLYVDTVYQDTEVVDAAPIIYTYDLATDINHMRVDDKKDITVYVVKSHGDKQENTGLTNEGVNIYIDDATTGTSYTLKGGKILAEELPTKINSLKIEYSNQNYGTIYATVTFYEDAEKTYILYHNSWEPQTIGGQIYLSPPEPSEKSYSEYPESLTTGQSGWYTKYIEATYSEDKTTVTDPGSVYRCVKVARASQEGSVDWGPVEKMSGAATTRADILGLLDGEDGIYNENGKIYVKANGIKSGALLVGELTDSKPGPNTVLYANAEDGTFWATKGKIGSMSIDAVGSALPTYGNENNLLTWHTVEGKKVVLLNETVTTGGLSKISLANIQEKDGIITLYKDEDNTNIEKEEVFYRFCNPNTSTNFLHTMIKGEKYTLSGYIRIRKSSNKTISLKIRNQYYANGTWQDAIEEAVWIKESDGENKWVYFSKSFIINNDAQGYYISLQVYGLDPSGNQGRFSGTDFGFKKGATIELSGLQLVEEKMSANVSGGYSWKFSPTEGIKMWKGAQTDTYKVFSIDSENDLWMNGSGTFTGKIIAEKGGSIAGWYIDSNGLTKGEIGSTDNYPFHMYTSFPPETVTVAGQPANDWRLIIGDSFGVTEEGGVYATKGKIGGVEIDQIAAKTNENLASKANIKNSSVTVNSESYPIFNITKTDAYGGTYIALNNISPEEGKKYTLSYYFQASSGLKNIGGHTGGLEANKVTWILDGTKMNVAYSEGAALEDTKVHYVTVTFEAKSQITNDNKLYIQPNRLDSTPVTYKLWNIKLEKGEVATPYIKAGVDESGDLNVVSNKFSWKFSPTEGMFMWNGYPSASTTDKTKGAVLAIYNAGTVDQPKHKLSMRGYIEADGGRIGLLDIYSGKYDMAFRKSSPTSLSVERNLQDFLPSSVSSYYISGETSTFSPNKIACAFNQNSMVGWNHGIDGKITIYKQAFSQTSSSPKYYAGRGFIHKTHDSLQITLPQKTNNTSAGYSDTRYFHILEIYDYYNATTPRMYTIYSKKANDPQAIIQLPPGEYCFAFFGGVSNSSPAQTLSLGQSEQEFLNQIDFKIYSTDFGISSDGGFWGKLSNNVESLNFANFSTAANPTMDGVDLLCVDPNSNTFVKIKENGGRLRNSLGWLHQMAITNQTNTINGISNHISIGYECQTGRTIYLYWGMYTEVGNKLTTVTPLTGGTVLHAQVSLYGSESDWHGYECPYVYSISGATFSCHVDDPEYGFLWLAIVAK